MTRRIGVLGLAAFAALGIADGMLGPAWPAIRAQLHEPLAALGEIAALTSAGAVVSGLVAGRLRQRLHPAGYLAAGAAVGTGALVLFAVSPWWGGLLVAAFVLGVGGAAVDAGFNAQLALHHGPRLTNAVHASYGVGATAGPLVVAAALAAGSWRIAWVVAAAAWAAIAILLRVNARGFDAPVPERWRGVRAPGGPGALTVMLALFFLAVGVEAAVGAWGATLLRDRGWSGSAAAVWVASYWAAFTGGRALLSLAGGRLRPELALRLGSAVLVGGLVVLLRSPLGLPLAGLGVAAFFPALVTLTPSRLGPERVAAAVPPRVPADSW